MSDAADFAKHCANPEDIDAYFCNFYSEHDFSNLRAVRDSLLSDNSLSQWQPLLAHCFDIFEIDRHLPMIPALICSCNILSVN
jgi:hypothetical protein